MQLTARRDNEQNPKHINGRILRDLVAQPAQPKSGIPVRSIIKSCVRASATAGLLASVALSILPAVAQAQATTPDAPRNLMAKVGNAQVILKWGTPYDGGSAITGYEYRQQEGTGPLGDWMAIPNSGKRTTSYTVLDLTNGTAYTFEVRAENAEGKGAEASASATPSISETASPELEYLAVYRGLYLVFDELLDGNSVPDPSAFEVSVDEASLNVTEVSILSTDQKIVFLGLVSYVSLSYLVTVSYTPPAMNQIKDLAGNAAAGFSTPILLVPPRTAPFAPRNLMAEAGNAQVILKWDTPYHGGSAITDYEYRQQEGTGPFGDWMAIPNSEWWNYTVSGLTNGTDYTFEVRAENAEGKGTVASASAMPTTPPPPPPLPPLTSSVPQAPNFTGLYVDDGKLTVVGHVDLGIAVPRERHREVVSSFKVQWKSGAQEYDSSRQEVINQPASASGATQSATYIPSNEITGLTNGVEYTVRIIATNSYGDSPPSVERTGTPNPKSEQLRQFIEDDIVKKHESSFPWLRNTWDYMKTNNVTLYVRNFGSSKVDIFCSRYQGQGLSPCYVQSMTITTDVLDGDADSKKRTILRELAHVYTLANGVSTTPAPLAMAHLYFESLNVWGSSCATSESELYADILASLVLGGSTTGADYWNSCKGDGDSPTALAVVRSAAAGQEPSWFADTYNDSNGDPDLEQVWADLIGMGPSNYLYIRDAQRAVAYQLRNQFGGYCDEDRVLKAIRSESVARAVTRNPWQDGGCVPGAPTSLETNSTGDGKITVSWEAPASNGGSLLSGYIIQWKSGDYWQTMIELFNPWETYRPSHVSETISELTNGVEYTFQVLAYNQNGDGTAAQVKATPSATDIAEPEFLTATVERASLVLTYSEALDETSGPPATSTFTVMVAGNTRSVDDVSVEGSAVTLTLSSKVASGDAVTVSYTVPTDVNDPRIQDAAGNDAEAITGETVTNNTLPVSSDATLQTVEYSYPRSHGSLGTYFSFMSTDVDSSVETITLLARPTNEYATVEYDPADADATTDGYQASLSPGDNLITITVTADNGVTTKTYLLTVTRSDNDNRPATGLVAISGTAQVGQTLTASLLGIVDLDGLDNVTFSYQWIANDGNADADIQGATKSTYELVDDDEGKTIKVKVTFTDDRDNTETLTSVATTEVSAKPNSPATGAPTISGTPQVGQTLTAATAAITDADGLDNVTFRYQWIANDGSTDADIENATKSTYELVDDDEGKTIKVKVTFTDDRDNTETLTSVATTEVSAKPNSPATGAPTISGTPQVGQTLTAATAAITDADGLDNVTFRYQWIANDGSTDADIENATKSTYELVDDDEGKTIKVKVTFTDDRGNEETLVSVATTEVAALNSLESRQSLNTSATGAPTINGTPLEGQTLTVDVSGIEDADGLTNPKFRYQWIHVDLTSFTDIDIANATGSTYTVTADDEGKAIKVKVTFTDDRDNEETLTSIAVLATEVVVAKSEEITDGEGVGTIQEEPGQDNSGPLWSADMSVVDFGNGSIGAWGADKFSNVGGTENLEARWLWYHTGDRKLHLAFTTAIKDATGLSLYIGDVAVAFPDGAGDSSFSWTGVDVAWTDGETVPVRIARGSPTVEATNAVPTGAPTISGTPQVGQTLTAATAAITDADGLDDVSFSYQWLADDADIQGATKSTYELVDDDEGKTIKVKVTFTDDRDNAESLTSVATTEVSAKPNSPATGAPIISGTPQVGQTLTAGVSAITDADGLDNASFSYQWLADDADIQGATKSTYELVDDDEGKTIKVKVTFTDDRDNAETLTSVATTEVSAKPNSPATGAPTISGTPQVGQTLTAATAAITDADGLDDVSYSYQWLADDADIQGATKSTYELVDDDEGKTIKVKVTFTDDRDNAETLTSVATTEVSAKPNSPATGAPTISGTPQVGQTLTAATAAITDADGLDDVSYSYQWLADDADIQGATKSTYELVDDDEGKTIKVKVTFTDDRDNTESLTSVATTEVSAKPNSPATGAPTISGTPQVGQTLTAATAAITDADGLDDVSFSYQWLADDADIQGATKSTYELVDDDEGKTIKVKVTFTDDRDNTESLTSVATTEVSAKPNSPATGAPTISGTPQVGQTLTAATAAITDADGLDDVSFSYQWLADDADIQGATKSTYELVDDDEGKTIKVKVTFTDDRDNAESLTSVATTEVSAKPNSPATGAPIISGTPQVGQTLTAGVSAITDADGLDNASFSYQWLADDADIQGATKSTYELVDDDEGKTIKVKVTFTDDRDNAESLTSVATTEVSAKPNSPATGAPTISGTPQVGQTLTAGVSAITDADGLDDVSYSYQWLADDADIQGATKSTYELVDDDEGKTIKVKVTFTDDRDNTESLTSVATTEVSAKPNSPATGAPTISGTPQVGQTLTAATAAITDADGLDDVSYSYQWLADDADIQGATKSTYELVDDDEGKTIKVKVTFTDDRDNTESLTSVATTEVSAKPNSPATGAPTISGTPQVGQTLTAATAAITDADGLDDVSFSYQWLADDADIQGATKSTYELVDDDEGKTIKVKVTFTDDRDNAESLTSVATTEVSVPVPLTASFTGVPASHDGANVFTFNLSFNEPVAVSYKVLRDKALSASTGKVNKCRRVDGRNDLWEVHIEPHSNADITVTLSSPSSDCDDSDAVCTADDKLLSNEPSVTIAGPSAKVVAASGPPGLAPNAPNPFNASTLIPYRLAMPGAVRLEIYNLLGQPMRTLVDQVQDAGVYLVPWDARDQRGAAVAAGVYLVRLQYPGGVQTRRLLYLK